MRTIWPPSAVAPRCLRCGDNSWTLRYYGYYKYIVAICTRCHGAENFKTLQEESKLYDNQEPQYGP